MNKNKWTSMLALVTVTLTSASALAASYSGWNGTQIGRFEVENSQIAEQAVVMIQSKQAPSEELRAKLEEKRAEMAKSIGNDAARDLSDEALAVLLITSQE